MIAIPTLAADLALPATDAAREAAIEPLEDPVSRARRFAALGFTRLHLLENDPSRSSESGREGARELLRLCPLLVQAEAREADEGTIADLLAVGAQWIVTGPIGVEDASRLSEIVLRLPGRIVVDLEGRGMVRWDPRRWAQVFELLAEFETLPLAGLLMSAPNTGAAPAPATLARIEELAVASTWPLQVRCLPDSLQALRNLADRGVACALFPAAVDPDALDARLVAEEFAA